MVLGWVPFKIVFDSPTLHSRWLLLHVIFYQNMPNLHNRYKLAERKISQKKPEYMLNYSFPCSCSKYLSSFWLILKQQWTIEEISIFSNSSHLEWRAGLSNTILKGTHPGTIPARFGLIWFSGFRGEDLNVIFYQNMPRKLLSQYQPNFAEMILGWPPSKIVSVDPDFQPRWSPS
jgi:hypothetical protein